MAITYSSVESLSSRSINRVLIIAEGADNGGALPAPVEAVRAAFTHCGHSVRVTSPDAWHVWPRESPPQVILLHFSTDEATPDLVAVERLCRQVRGKEELREVPVAVIVTQAPDEEEDGLPWSEARAAGVDDALVASLPRAVLDSRLDLLARYGQVRHELAETRAELARHTQLDYATQLTTRRFFFQSAHRECSRARRYRHSLACLMLDVDYFDRISKNFGASTGDYVLRSVAYIVRQWTRDSDVLGRFGPSKIAILLPETKLEGAAAARDKIQRAVAESHFEWQGESLPVTVSIGEAVRNWDETEIHHLPTDNEGEAIAARDAATRAAIERGLASRPEAPLSVREELAELLADADAALTVARKAVLCPPLFVEYALESA